MDWLLFLVQQFEQTELWRHRCIVGSYLGKALTDLGDHAGAETVLRENLAVAERRGEALPLTYARLYLARLLCHLAPPEQLDEPEQLARAVIAGKNASLLGLAHGVLAGLALRRGDPATAENEVRIACEWVRPFPTYSWELLALRVRLLLALGRPEEALGIGEAALQQCWRPSRPEAAEPSPMVHVERPARAHRSGRASGLAAEHPLADRATWQDELEALRPVAQRRLGRPLDPRRPRGGACGTK
jgi:tetratricopeptide (TPR) repeat protein